MKERSTLLEQSYDQYNILSEKACAEPAPVRIRFIKKTYGISGMAAGSAEITFNANTLPAYWDLQRAWVCIAIAFGKGSLSPSIILALAK